MAGFSLFAGIILGYAYGISWVVDYGLTMLCNHLLWCR
jgi:hypothetical protein